MPTLVLPGAPGLGGSQHGRASQARGSPEEEVGAPLHSLQETEAGRQGPGTRDQGPWPLKEAHKERGHPCLIVLKSWEGPQWEWDPNQFNSQIGKMRLGEGLTPEGWAESGFTRWGAPTGSQDLLPAPPALAPYPPHHNIMSLHFCLLTDQFLTFQL